MYVLTKEIDVNSIQIPIIKIEKKKYDFTVHKMYWIRQTIRRNENCKPKCLNKRITPPFQLLTVQKVFVYIVK